MKVSCIIPIFNEEKRVKNILSIITKVKEHGKNDHKMSPNDFTPELLEKIKGSIKEAE